MSTLPSPPRVVIGTDGRRSMVRADAGLQVRNFGAPRDVVWMKLPKEADDVGWASDHCGLKNNFIMLDLGDYWQCGYSIVKGSFDALQQQGLAALLLQVAAVAPVGVERLRQHITNWRQVKLLDINIDQLTHWAAPVYCALTLPPMGGSVNFAIQNAVATAPSRQDHWFGVSARTNAAKTWCGA